MQSVANADWNDYTGCKIIESHTSIGFDWASAHRPTGNDAILVVLGYGQYVIQFHIDQLKGLWVRNKGNRNEDFSEWNHLITIQ